MSTRKVLVDLSKNVTRAWISKTALPKTAKRLLFTTEKPEIKGADNNTHFAIEIDRLPQKFISNYQHHRTELLLHDANTHQQKNKQLDPNYNVLQNMENGRYSISLHTAPSRTYAETSVSGSEVLISWFEDNRGSIWTTKLLGLEILDARTSKSIRQNFENIQAAMITPSYLVFREDKCCWKIRSRSSNSTKTVVLPRVNPHYYEEWRSNNAATETILIVEFDRFYVIDLETGKIQEFKRPDAVDEPVYDIQLCGTLVAYRENHKNPIIRVIDTESGKEVLKRECSVFTEFYLRDFQIALAEIDLGKITWSIIDIDGKTTKKGNFETRMHTDWHYARNVSVYKNFMIINQGPLVHFVDITSGKLLTSLLSHGVRGYDQVSGFGEGKFIISTGHCIQVVDFESPRDPAIDQPVRVVVINPNDTVSIRKGTINEMANGLVYSNTWKPCQPATLSNSEKKLLPLSVMVYLSENERVTLVYFASKSVANNGVIVTRIVNGMEKKATQYNYEARPVANVTKNFYGRGLLYKEELVDETWIPVDLSVQQAEEFINSL